MVRARLRLSPWASLVMGLSLSFILVIFFVGSLPGDLVTLDPAFSLPFIVYGFAALFVAVFEFNAFLQSGHQRSLWVGLGFFLFAAPFLLVLTTQDVNARHAYSLLAILLAALTLLYASLQERLVQRTRRLGVLARALLAALGVMVLLSLGVASFTPLVSEGRHTLVFRLLSGLAAVVFVFVSLLFLRVHAVTRRPAHLGLAAATVWLSGAALALSFADVHTATRADEWHWIAHLQGVAASFVTIAGFLAQYRESAMRMLGVVHMPIRLRSLQSRRRRPR